MVKTMKNKERYGSKKMLRLRGVGVMKCRKKPVIVEAIQYDKEHIEKALSFCGVLDYNPHDN